jgi:hypothetical protein
MNLLDPQAIAQALGRPQREGKRFRATCPVCQKHTFTIGLSDDGQTILIKCWSGCSQQQVVEALRRLNLWPAPSANGHRPAGDEASAALDPLGWLADYCAVPRSFLATLPIEPQGAWLAFTFPSGAAKLRKAGSKDIVWRIPGGAARPALWPLPAPGEPLPGRIYLLEGETDTIIGRRLGLPAYACTAGAGTPLKPHEAEALAARGVRRVTLLFDSDEVGRQGAQKQAQVLHAAGIEVWVADLAQAKLADPLAGLKDLLDAWRASRARGEAPERLRQALEQAAQPWTPPVVGEAVPAAVGAAEPTTGTSPPAPPFPLELLPPLTQSYVRVCAQAIVCPEDFIALPLLVAAGAAVGGACELELKPGWREGSNLYAAIIGCPGSKKSPALDAALRPLHRVQALLAKDWQAEHERYEADLQAWEAAPKAERGPRPKEPPFPHLFTTDATTEALTAMLAPGRGVLLELDELAGWVLGMNQYKNGRGADRQFYLKCWSRATVKTDRRTHPRPIVAERPHLSVVGGVQPDLLPLLADPLGRQDGFVDRLLLAYPEPVPDRWTDAGVDVELGDRLTVCFLRLRRWAERATPSPSPSPEDGDADPRPTVVRLAPEAAELWRQWYLAHTAEPAPEGLAGPWAKLPSQAARLALTLHCLLAAEAGAGDTAIPDRLDTQTLAAALDLIDEYVKPHWQKAAPCLKRWEPARAPSDLGLRVLQALRQHGALSMRGLHALFGRNLPAERLRAALEDLEAAGLVRRESTGRHGPGRPAEIWTVADPAHTGPQ